MPPRILFLHHAGIIGGAELHLRSLAQHFRERGKVILFADGPLRSALEKCDVPVRVFSSDWAASGVRGGEPIFSARNITEVLRLAWQVALASSSVDLVIANSPRALFVASLARLVRPRPLVWILHDLLDQTHFHPRALRLIVRVANQSATRVLADSNAIANAFIGAGGRANVVRVVYCGVPAFPLTEHKRDLGRTLGVFGRISPWKGQDVVLRALAHLPEASAIFVGAEEDAEYARSLRELTRELGLENRVQFFGFRSDVTELMQTVDCIVHASTAPEPFGLVIVEGMLARRPVIATRAGGAAEIIEDGISGLLVRPGEVEELRAALERIFANPTEAGRLAQNGYDRARALFSEERMLRETEAHFEEAARMKIAIDLTALNAKPSGIDRYLVGMVRALACLERTADFILFINLEDRARFSPPNDLPADFRVIPICLRPRFVRLFFQQLLLPLLLRVWRIDVLHSPTFILPLWGVTARHVLTIHDLSSFVLPQFHPPLRRSISYAKLVRASMRRADVISVPSAAVKEDIVRLLPEIGADRVQVIPCGIDEIFYPRKPAEVEPTLERLGIPRPYLLFVGTRDPRKNLSLLLEAFALLRDRPEHLVIVGGSSWSPETLPAHSKIHYAGYVTEQDLPFVYAGAALFVYPSFLEGFGFPPLEAMASGVPVIAADNSSLRENLAGAATLISADDARQLAAAMQELLGNEALRERAISAGLACSGEFRWENFAEKTFACYEGEPAQKLFAPAHERL